MSATAIARRPRTPHRGGRPTVIGTVVLLAAVSLLVLLPIIWMLGASLRTQADLFANPGALWPTQVTFDNYLAIWDRLDLPKLFLNTVVFAGAVTLVSVPLDALAGYALARYKFRGRNALFVVIVFTMMVPVQVTFIPLYQLLAQVNWLDTYQGLIVPKLADAFGIFFFRQIFLAMPRELEDAARVDGASELRIWATIMMPLARAGTLTLGLFNLLACWNSLLWPMVVSTDPSMATLSQGLALFKGQGAVEYGPIMAGAVLALVPMLVTFVIVQRRFVAGIATMGLK